MAAFLSGIAGSVIASFIFWVLTFKYSGTNVVFSNVIEKNKSGKNCNYRIKFINYGSRNLNEVSVIAKISMSVRNTRENTYLSVGNGGMLPVMYGKKLSAGKIIYPNPTVLKLYVGDKTINEFKKPLYADYIREKAKNEELGLNHIFAEYKDKVKIQLFVYGNDSVTGVRRVFVSPQYSIKNIEEGKYKKTNLNKWYYSKKKVREIISQVSPLYKG